MDDKNDIKFRHLLETWEDDLDLEAAFANLKLEVVLMVKLGKISKSSLNAIHDYYIDKFKCMLLGHPSHRKQGPNINKV